MVWKQRNWQDKKTNPTLRSGGALLVKVQWTYDHATIVNDLIRIPDLYLVFKGIPDSPSAHAFEPYTEFIVGRVFICLPHTKKTTKWSMDKHLISKVLGTQDFHTPRIHGTRVKMLELI